MVISWFCDFLFGVFYTMPGTGMALFQYFDIAQVDGIDSLNQFNFAV